jgi:hypothetical protein
MKSVVQLYSGHGEVGEVRKIDLGVDGRWSASGSVSNEVQLKYSCCIVGKSKGRDEDTQGPTT